MFVSTVLSLSALLRRGGRFGFLVLLLVLQGGLALAGPLSSATLGTSERRLTAPDIQRILDRGALLVAMPGFDAPPFFREVKGELRGIDVDLARGLARELNVPVRFLRKANTFNETVEQVRRGEADLAIGKLSRTLERARYVRFSDPYFITRHALALNRSAFARFAGGRDMATVIRQYDGSLGVIQDSSFADMARRNFPAARIVPYPGWAELVAAVIKGEVIAAYRDEFEMKRLLRQDPSVALQLRVVSLTDTQESLSVVLPHDTSQLLELVNFYLAQQPGRFTVERALQRLDEDR